MIDPAEPADLARFERLSNDPAWRIVADSLRRKIALGLYRPGEQLPPERQLAEHLGVSRITVREALRVLQGERLIESRRGNSGGPMVLAPPARPADELREELRRDRDRFQQILDCRAANEALAARLACATRTDAHLAALERTIPDLEAASRALESAAEAQRAALEFRRQDSIFHLTLAAIPANPYLYRTVEWLRAEFFTPLDFLNRARNEQDSAREHAAIVTAIRDRDAEVASGRMRLHIESTRRALDQLLAG